MNNPNVQKAIEFGKIISSAVSGGISIGGIVKLVGQLKNFRKWTKER
jgi:hypothetical protein